MRVRVRRGVRRGVVGNVSDTKQQMIVPDHAEMLPHLDVRLSDQVPNTHIRGAGSFNCGDLTRHIYNKQPLCYLRFSDGEFRQMMPGPYHRSYNADFHRYNEDMGRELRDILLHSLEAAATDPAIRIEISGPWRMWSGMRTWEESVPDRLRPYLVADTFWCAALQNGEYFMFLDALRACDMPKLLVTGPRAENIADAIGATFIPTEPRDSYSIIDRVEAAVRAAVNDRPYILLVSCSMVSECLMWRLWDKSSIMVDLGHSCDALNGYSTRSYLKGGMAAIYAKRFQEWATTKGE